MKETTIGKGDKCKTGLIGLYNVFLVGACVVLLVHNLGRVFEQGRNAK